MTNPSLGIGPYSSSLLNFSRFSSALSPRSHALAPAISLTGQHSVIPQYYRLSIQYIWGFHASQPSNVNRIGERQVGLSVSVQSVMLESQL